MLADELVELKVMESISAEWECEFSFLGRQCLDKRLPDIQTVSIEAAAWGSDRKQNTKSADWRVITQDARIKLKRLYPK